MHEFCFATAKIIPFEVATILNGSGCVDSVAYGIFDFFRTVITAISSWNITRSILLLLQSIARTFFLIPRTSNPASISRSNCAQIIMN